ncbi:antibiotic biosynthesis monooxygenase [Campylobacter sp. MIT 99-7217]|uniref:putative quinol monooxygenase n=1 Tax=Campylobacter sp. MIT 99-7217 TaxID=535091 RepID=UPI00115831B2|nr:putative quinol monooxygenase [Campylobacter sp. MIT 99-7217]TQR34693.1 antibiotic biosynthesis monooxygenase [Campylobacter sp. MIT 99-7217]
MIRVVARVWLKPSKFQDFVAVAKELVEKSRQEQGCIAYDLVKKDESMLCFIEAWQDQKALTLHTQTKHYIKAKQAFSSLVSKNELEIFTPLDET